MAVPEKEVWRAGLRRRRKTGLSASQFGAALGLCGCISDYVHYRRVIVGTDQEFTGNAATANGIRTEPLAKLYYELLVGAPVDPGGFFVDHESDGALACSPDGIVTWRDAASSGCRAAQVDEPTTQGAPCSSSASSGRRPLPHRVRPATLLRRTPHRLLEIKSPMRGLYSDAKDGNRPFGIPQQYMCQMQGQMAISGADECDFFEFVLPRDGQDAESTVMVCAYRVYRSDTFWSWARPKLLQVANFMAAPAPLYAQLIRTGGSGGGGGLLDRSFAFRPFFDWSQIRVEPLIAPVELVTGRDLTDQRQFNWWARAITGPGLLSSVRRFHLDPTSTPVPRSRLPGAVRLLSCLLLLPGDLVYVRKPVPTPPRFGTSSPRSASFPSATNLFAARDDVVVISSASDNNSDSDSDSDVIVCTPPTLRGRTAVVATAARRRRKPQNHVVAQVADVAPAAFAWPIRLVANGDSGPLVDSDAPFSASRPFAPRLFLLVPSTTADRFVADATTPRRPARGQPQQLPNQPASQLDDSDTALTPTRALVRRVERAYIPRVAEHCFDAVVNLESFLAPFVRRGHRSLGTGSAVLVLPLNGAPIATSLIQRLVLPGEAPSIAPPPAFGSVLRPSVLHRGSAIQAADLPRHTSCAQSGIEDDSPATSTACALIQQEHGSLPLSGTDGQAVVCATRLITLGHDTLEWCVDEQEDEEEDAGSAGRPNSGVMRLLQHTAVFVDTSGDAHTSEFSELSSDQLLRGWRWTYGASAVDGSCSMVVFSSPSSAQHAARMVATMGPEGADREGRRRAEGSPEEEEEEGLELRRFETCRSTEELLEDTMMASAVPATAATRVLSAHERRMLQHLRRAAVWVIVATRRRRFHGVLGDEDGGFPPTQASWGGRPPLLVAGVVGSADTPEEGFARLRALALRE